MKSNPNYADWQFSRDVLRKITREWFLHLSALERLAVLFVYDRTFGWNKRFERITLDQFSKGVWSSPESGNEQAEQQARVCYAAPFTRDRTSASRIIRDLTERGVLIVTHESRRSGNAKLYALNVDWNPTSTENTLMKLPKRLKQPNSVKRRVESDEGGIDFNTDDSIDSNTLDSIDFNTQRETKEEEKQNDKIPNAGGVRVEVEKSIRSIKAKSKKRLLDKSQAGRMLRSDATGFHPTKAALTLVWRDLFSTHFPNEPISEMTAATRTILWNYWKTWTLARKSGEFREYLDWLFECWNSIRVGTFSWMDDCPKVPQARIIVNGKLRVMLEETYQHKDRLREWSKLEPSERAFKRLVEDQGMDRDAATKIVQREHASATELRRIREERAKLKIQQEQLERVRRQTSGNGDSASGATRKRTRTPKTPLSVKSENFGEWKEI